MNIKEKAVVLLFGGLDSTTVLAIAKEKYDVYALSFDYGQKQQAELNAAKQIAKQFEVVTHNIFPINIGELGGSALTDSQIAIPDYEGGDHIPTTYVPARNTVFLSIALAWAETIGAYDIFIGASSVDYSHYPDCRPEFFEAYNQMAAIATKVAVEGKPIQIQTPLLHLSKAETILQGIQRGVDYSLTTSCYRMDDQGFACGSCDSCTFRKKGFREAQVADPTHYQHKETTSE